MAKEIPEPGASPATVTTFKDGIATYEQKYVDCGKDNCGSCNTSTGRYPSHGPYWYLCVPKNGKWYRIYLGKHCDTTRFRRADGSINWQEVQERRRRKQEGKHDDKAIPGQEDMVNRTAAASRQANPRGPAHIVALEDLRDPATATD